ncbi:protein trichome birefringence-like 13 isoform X2 [Olea europaea var. sylvestris]|uniref:protein trichome birefringence-like 13 isoform X2 n=1 Tax=Olea europaea var. sylvestris TaxID=158386 RepID=UPI000C1D4732|nr:protein trichome birefringence-like 13 isoform X2 [Olea europaea var. sylvestris]
MATRDHYSRKPPTSATTLSTSRLILALLCLASLFICFSLFKSDNVQSPVLNRSAMSKNINYKKCNYTDGRWIYDLTVRSPPRYDHTCKEIYKGWNCLGSNKSNALDIVKWRWKPDGCDLPQFDPLKFLQDFRDTNIGFVGDSLNRNMFVSLFCTLKRVSSEVKKWRPVGADRGFTFIRYNLTMAYHRTNLLARYGRWTASNNAGVLESLGYKEGYRVDVDIPEGTWAEAPNFHDILIFNTGHWWWAPSKFDPIKSPMLFFEKGIPVMPPAPPHVGLDMVLSHMISFVGKKARPGAILIFRTQSPRHFEGGDWDQGGSCSRLQPLAPQEVQEFFSLKNNGTNMEARLVNQHLYKALKGSVFHILDITRMSEYRADAHPSAAGGKKHDDCMHWCLPGLTDTWNDLFMSHLNDFKVFEGQHGYYDSGNKEMSGILLGLTSG